jgi:hypothetical protein
MKNTINITKLVIYFILFYIGCFLLFGIIVIVSDLLGYKYLLDKSLTILKILSFNYA